jgi:hypothetical protein
VSGLLLLCCRPAFFAGFFALMCSVLNWGGDGVRLLFVYRCFVVLQWCVGVAVVCLLYITLVHLVLIFNKISFIQKKR